MLLLYAATIFLSAALLFLVQPMIAKMLLPMLGGSPAVWNTSMVFFQAVLLAGYLYAHLLSKLRSARVQVAVHAVVLAAALLCLPVPNPWDWEGPVGQSPVLWLLGALALAVGGPFFVLSTTGPLLQRWFARTSHAAARDPYFLYAASNAGSMIALLGYPVLMEPALTLGNQRRFFAAGCGVFAALVLGCAGLMVARRAAPEAGLTRAQRRELQRQGTPSSAGAGTTTPAAPITWRRRGLWVALAFVPSSLTLGVTQHFSTDVAAVPMVWVIPLAVYLLTFVLAFSGRPGVTPAAASKLLPWLVLSVAAVMLAHMVHPIGALMGLHLLTLFIAAMLCHGRLAASRPEPARLTEFYLLIAVGGVLGGLFNSVVAPLVFNTVAEYPAALVMALLLRLPAGADDRRTDPLLALAGLVGVRREALQRHERAVSVVLTALAPVLVLVAYLGSKANLDAVGMVGGIVYWVAWFGPALAVCWMLHRWRLAFALGLAALFYAQLAPLGVPQHFLLRERSFFGLHRVESDPGDNWRTLSHGTTRHGLQSTGYPLRYMPTTYFHPTGPIGDVFREMWGREGYDRVAIVGLGAGAMAAYSREGQRFTFFEIDPAVVRIASPEAGLFTYLADAQGAVDVVLGDARLRLAEAPDGAYDLIILDAFSSDSIPLHLVTLEAVEMYRRKLAPGGLIAFHVSNRYLDLRPVLVGIAGRLEMIAAERDEPDYTIPLNEVEQGKSGSTWVVLARAEADLGGLAAKENWAQGRATAGTPVWTDDYSNIFSVFRWR